MESSVAMRRTKNFQIEAVTGSSYCTEAQRNLEHFVERLHNVYEQLQREARIEGCGRNASQSLNDATSAKVVPASTRRVDQSGSMRATRSLSSAPTRVLLEPQAENLFSCACSPACSRLKSSGQAELKASIVLGLSCSIAHLVL